MTTCLVLQVKPLAEIIKECPKGQVPMFEVASGYDDRVVGEMIYVIDGLHYEICISRERVAKRVISSMHFRGYVVP